MGKEILGLEGYGTLLPFNMYVRRSCQLFIFSCICWFIFEQTVDCQSEFAFFRPWAIYMPALQLLGTCVYGAIYLRSQSVTIRLMFFAIIAPFSATGVLPHSSFIVNWMSSL